MKRLALLIAPLALISLLVLAGCGKSAGGGGSSQTSTPANTIQMDTNNFTAHAITVQANQPVTLDDTVDGGALHILCVGTGNGGSNTCDTTDKTGGAPKEFIGQGMQVQAGDKKTVTFTKAGTYHVICTLHGGMFIDVTVQ